MRIFISRLLQAAASQAKKDALAQKYKLDPQVVDKLEGIDPTSNGEYMEWLAREASRSNLPGIHELAEVEILLKEYIKVKRNPEWTGEKNILNLTYDVFKPMMEEVSREDYSRKQKIRDIEENAKKYIQEGVKYLGKVRGCYVYQVTTPLASAAMSAGTHWCTQNESTSASYLEGGSIYIFTKPEHKNSYDNDKYVQIYSSRQRLEAEDAEGKDLSSNTKYGLIFTEECLEFTKFLADHDQLIKGNLESGKIRVKEEDHIECASCHDSIEEGDVHEAEGDTYCQDCFYDNFASCDHCGDTININNDEYVSGEDGTWCMDCGNVCQGCGHGYCVTGRGSVPFYDVTDERGREEAVCERCFNRNYFSCSDCGEGKNNDEGREFENEYVCNKCFKKLWSDEVADTLDKWIEESGEAEAISSSGREQAEKEFRRGKERLAGDMFKKMQADGYLYSWDDLDLATALTYIPEEMKGPEPAQGSYAYRNVWNHEWARLNKIMTNPLAFLTKNLLEKMYGEDALSEEWGSDEVIEWLVEDGIIEDDHFNRDYNWFRF